MMETSGLGQTSGWEPKWPSLHVFRLYPRVEIQYIPTSNYKDLPNTTTVFKWDT